MPKIRVLVDEDLCIGAASCVTIAPETFQLEVTDEEYEQILLGAQSCPTLAVFIYNEAGEQLFPDM